MTLIELLSHVVLSANVELRDNNGQFIMRTEARTMIKSPYIFNTVKDYVILDMFAPGTLAALEVSINDD